VGALRLVVVLGVVGAVAGGAWWASRTLEKPSANGAGGLVAASFPASPGGPLPSESRPRIPLDEFDKASSPRDRLEALKRAYEARPGSSETLRQQEAEHREQARLKFLADVRTHLHNLIADEEEHPSHLADDLQQAQQYIRWLEEIHSYDAHPALKKEEEACIQLCQTWVKLRSAAAGE
jgi:hypothetical protein